VPGHLRRQARSSSSPPSAGGLVGLPWYRFTSVRGAFGGLGAVYDFGAAGMATWADTKQLAGDIGGAASSVWHGLTSIF
jgi:hypothetical protein